MENNVEKLNIKIEIVDNARPKFNFKTFFEENDFNFKNDEFRLEIDSDDYYNEAFVSLKINDNFEDWSKVNKLLKKINELKNDSLYINLIHFNNVEYNNEKEDDSIEKFEKIIEQKVNELRKFEKTNDNFSCLTLLPNENEKQGTYSTIFKVDGEDNKFNFSFNKLPKYLIVKFDKESENFSIYTKPLEGFETSNELEKIGEFKNHLMATFYKNNDLYEYKNNIFLDENKVCNKTLNLSKSYEKDIDINFGLGFNLKNYKNDFKEGNAIIVNLSSNKEFSHGFGNSNYEINLSSILNVIQERIENTIEGLKLIEINKKIEEQIKQKMKIEKRLGINFNK